MNLEIPQVFILSPELLVLGLEAMSMKNNSIKEGKRGVFCNTCRDSCLNRQNFKRQQKIKNEHRISR